MEVTKRYNQHRRDLYIDIKCESCGNERTVTCAYDDRNYWDNVVPNFKCEECNKSSNDLQTKPVHIPTKYPEGFQV